MDKSSRAIYCFDNILSPIEFKGCISKKSRDSHIGIKSVIAGGIAGAVQLFVTYPIEYVKTQVQLDEKGSSLYDGSWDCAKKTFQERGVLGFYRGMMVALLGYIHKVGVRFYVLELMHKAFQDTSGQLSMNMKLVSGLVAGTAEAVVAVTPFETLKVKFINDERSLKPQYRGLVQGIKTIIQNEGVRGVYQGLTPTILKEGTNQAIRYSVVQSLKESYTGGDRRKHVPMFWTAIFGAVGGFTSVLCNTPIDVVKTRMQSMKTAKYKNTFDCAIQIWRREGPLAFYKGIWVRATRVSVDVAITFMVYDKLMNMFRKIL